MQALLMFSLILEVMYQLWTSMAVTRYSTPGITPLDYACLNRTMENPRTDFISWQNFLRGSSGICRYGQIKIYIARTILRMVILMKRLFKYFWQNTGSCLDFDFKNDYEDGIKENLRHTEKCHLFYHKLYRFRWCHDNIFLSIMMDFISSDGESTNEKNLGLCFFCLYFIPEFVNIKGM